MTTTHPTRSIDANELVARLAADEPVTILDIRDDAAWTIEAPNVTVRHVPAHCAAATLDDLARDLPDDTVILCNRGVTAQQLADRLLAKGRMLPVLLGGLRGWIATLRPVPVDLGVEDLRVLQIQRPGRGCLSYLVASGDQALVVDPAPDAQFYADLASELSVEIRDVVDTHLHADHLSGARELAAITGAALRLPAGSLERGVSYADSVTPLKDGDEIALGDLTVRAVHLPGHTTDMTGLVVADRALIGGDSLFADGLARPDLEQGDPDGSRAMARRLHATLHERILALGDDVVLLPGHHHPGVPAGAVAPTLAEVRARVDSLAIADPDAFAEDVVADMPPRPANYEAIIAVNSGTHPFDPELESGGNSCSAR
ncbi:MBL fold metallo-hydrolase [Paraconexibacter sp.]|uniref:MBL fold metallo-hydrolase n=1 Tax=Paraconexibacter sp. TaxID=2949640 RepID=UPI00356883FC